MTRINPLDLKQQEFNKSTFGGYSRNHVKNFLDSLAQLVEDNNEEKYRIETELQVTKTELSRLRKLEEALLQGLNDSKQISQELLAQSEKQAELVLYEANLKAQQTIANAKHQAKVLLEEANQQAYQALNTMRTELKQLEEQYVYMEKQRDFLLKELQEFIHETRYKIERMESHKRSVFYKEELDKANSIMKKNNDLLRKQFVQTTPPPQSATVSPDSPPINLATVQSFFDGL